MSRKLGKTLPDDLFERLQPEATEDKLNKVIPLCTIDDAGFPHYCLLSHREIAVKDRRNLRLATYQKSTTSNNLRRTGKATAMIMDEEMSYYIKGNVRELKPVMRDAPGCSMFNFEVEQVIEDREAGVPMTSGLTFQNNDAAGFVAYAKTTFNELLEE